MIILFECFYWGFGMRGFEDMLLSRENKKVGIKKSPIKKASLGSPSWLLFSHPILRI
jgi:hypothetical protein